jgi:hypothetical protein
MPCGKPCNCPSYRDHVASIAISGMGMPSRRPDIADIHRREKALEKDAPAYKRLRRDGLQPDHVDGSHALEASLS